MTNAAAKCISIVIPVFREERNVERLISRLDAVTTDISGYRWEYVFVNDGSTDNTLPLLRRLAAARTNIHVVDLARNFGKEIAMSAGVFYARGHAVICMDADLQHPPEIIPQFIKHWHDGADVVFTVRRSIRQSLMRRVASRIFYWIMSKVSEVDVISQTTDFRLIDRKVIDIFKTIEEKRRLFRGLIDWLGFKRVAIEFDAPEREGGPNSYSYARLWELALNSFISYSSAPLRIIGYLGVITTLLSGMLLTWMLVANAIFKPETGYYYTPLAMFVVGQTFLIGIVLSALGMMSLYISKIYSEVLHRPLFVVRETINIPSPSS